MTEMSGTEVADAQASSAVESSGDAHTASAFSSSPSASIISCFLELSSQQVQQLHLQLLTRSHSSSSAEADEASARLWEEATTNSSPPPIPLPSTSPPTPSPSTPSSPFPSSPSPSPPSSHSLLSPHALSSSSHIYAQLCHDLPLLTVDGVHSLTSAVRLHIQRRVLPSSFFSLHLPFLYHLLHLCASCPSPPHPRDDLSSALLSLYTTVIVSLLPLLLTSPLPDLQRFLSFIPTSLPACIHSLLSHLLLLHSTAPAPDVIDSLTPPHSPLSPDSASFTFDADADSEGDDDDEAREGEEFADGAGQGEAGQWREVEQRLEQVMSLWCPAWIEPTEQSATTLLRVLALATAHADLFHDTAVLRRYLAPVLSHLLLSTPTLTPNFLPPLLSDILAVHSLSLSALQAGVQEDSPSPSSLSALYFLAKLSSSPQPSSSPPSQFLFRLLRLNLPFLSSLLRWATAATDGRAQKQRSSILTALCSLVTFYMSQHEAKRSVHTDVGEELVACGILPLLVSALCPLHPTLVLACGLSSQAVRLCWLDTEWRSAMERRSAVPGVESCLLPVWLALRGVVRVDAVDGGKAREERKEAVPAKKTKGRQRLLVAQLADEEATAEPHGLLPPLAPAESPPSPLLPLLATSNVDLRAALTSAFPSASADSSSTSASVSSLTFLCALLQSMDAAASASPSLSALLRPLLVDAPGSGVLGSSLDVDTQLRQWGASVREVRRLAVEQLHSSGGASGELEQPPSPGPHASEQEGAARGEGDAGVQERSDADAERRSRMRSLAHAKRSREQRGEQLQHLLTSCKSLLSQGAKRD